MARTKMSARKSAPGKAPSKAVGAASSKRSSGRRGTGDREGIERYKEGDAFNPELPIESYTLKQLRDLAKGKLSGYSKMTKQELYNALSQEQPSPVRRSSGRQAETEVYDPNQRYSYAQLRQFLRYYNIPGRTKLKTSEEMEQALREHLQQTGGRRLGVPENLTQFDPNIAYDDYTHAILYRIGKAQNLPVKKKMNKEQLYDIVSRAAQGQRELPEGVGPEFIQQLRQTLLNPDGTLKSARSFTAAELNRLAQEARIPGRTKLGKQEKLDALYQLIQQPGEEVPQLRLQDLTVVELRKRASQLGIPRYSKMNKADLVAAIQAAMGSPVQTGRPSPRRREEEVDLPGETPTRTQVFRPTEMPPSPIAPVSPTLTRRRSPTREREPSPIRTPQPQPRRRSSERRSGTRAGYQQVRPFITAAVLPELKQQAAALGLPIDPNDTISTAGETFDLLSQYYEQHTLSQLPQLSAETVADAERQLQRVFGPQITAFIGGGNLTSATLNALERYLPGLRDVSNETAMVIAEIFRSSVYPQLVQALISARYRLAPTVRRPARRVPDFSRFG